MNSEDVQILCSLNNSDAAHGMMLASNNYSLATQGVPGNDPYTVFDKAYYALQEEAVRRGLIKK